MVEEQASNPAPFSFLAASLAMKYSSSICTRFGCFTAELHHGRSIRLMSPNLQICAAILMLAVNDVHLWCKELRLLEALDVGEVFMSVHGRTNRGRCSDQTATRRANSSTIWGGGAEAS
jgi:hypothetical protein